MYNKPLHYKEIKESLIEVGYYEFNGRKAPKDYTVIFCSLRLDSRFVRLKKGYYGLKEVNLGSTVSAELEADYAGAVEIIPKNSKIEAKINSEIENTKEVSEFNNDLNNNVILPENSMMNTNEMIDPERIMEVRILDIFKANYSEEEIKEIMERAKNEYYGQFLPRFLATELNKISERNKSRMEI